MAEESRSPGAKSRPHGGGNVKFSSPAPARRKCKLAKERTWRSPGAGRDFTRRGRPRQGSEFCGRAVPILRCSRREVRFRVSLRFPAAPLLRGKTAAKLLSNNYAKFSRRSIWAGGIAADNPALPLSNRSPTY